MKTFIKEHPIYFVGIGLAAICIIVLFFVAGCNHCYVDINIQKNIDSLSVNFENTKANIEIITKNISHESTQEKGAERVSQELESLCGDIDDAICEIIQLHQKTFDANTVTFLITFLSALLFTVFITLFIKNIEQFNKLYEVKTELDSQIVGANDRITKADTKIAEANDRLTKADTKIAEANDRITKADTKIAEAEKDWDIKQKYQEYLLKLAIERNNLTQILNLVSVLGSQLASSNYNIKPEYATLVYMIHRKTQLVLKEGFKDIKDIRSEDKAEFMQIITDCITYLNIGILTENNEVGLKTFTQLYNDLIDIRKKIENMQSRK